MFTCDKSLCDEGSVGVVGRGNCGGGPEGDMSYCIKFIRESLNLQF
jgi:hypothetical protein